MPTRPVEPAPFASPVATRNRVAVIDLGTNTFHLLIVEFTDFGTFVVKEKYKEAVKLGEGITQQVIAEAAFHRGIDALKKFRTLIDARGVSTVLAFGTSALRDAQNAAVFLDAAREEAGIAIRIINGNEEAALIYQGVRNGVVFPPGENVLLIDIGGGSVEFIVGTAQQAKLLRSTRLGAARLLEQIAPADPPSRADIAATRKVIAAQLDELLREIAEFQVRTVVGSSGTFETLGALTAAESRDVLAMQNPNGFGLSPARFQKLKARLLKASREERLLMPGMEVARVDMILMGVVLIDYVLQRLPIENILVSTYALKEGILYDYLETQRESALPHTEADRGLREKAIRAVGHKYHFEEGHANQVALLALQLFDELRGLHGYGPEERELLKYACLLHDIGHFVGRSGHHKHGQYILMNAPIQGFASSELLLLGNLVRYHRKSLPSKEHFHFNLLPKAEKELILRLSALLRLADCLDRGHRHLIRQLRALQTEVEVVVGVEASGEVDIELTAARENTELFEVAYGLPITFRAA
ncbi:MAG: Ppx/GppA phosphatase family protein [Bacteroidia bacterium]|nr:Ppx/GppA phosphatase family protein [Bacteroidia bacterium]